MWKVFLSPRMMTSSGNCVNLYGKLSGFRSSASTSLLTTRRANTLSLTSMHSLVCICLFKHPANHKTTLPCQIESRTPVEDLITFLFCTHTLPCKLLGQYDFLMFFKKSLLCSPLRMMKRTAFI